jgi:DNA-binding transcriptional MerR regulator
MQIGELAKRTGLNASRIRFYEAQGLISVTRRANGYRAYSAEALVALNIITSAQDAGFTLAQIRRLMPSGFVRLAQWGVAWRSTEESRRHQGDREAPGADAIPN